MAIFRGRIRATRKDRWYRKGQHVGYKIFDAKNIEDAKKKAKKQVGSGRKITSITKTRLKGTVKSRFKLPRSKRFGKRYY